VVVFDDALQYDDVRQAIADLDREGTMHLWGHFYGQAFAGRSATPPPSVQRLLADGRMEKLARSVESRFTRIVGSLTPRTGSETAPGDGDH
jgi:hypothetical protein